MRSIGLLLLLSVRATAGITCTAADNFATSLTTIPLTVVSGPGDTIVVFTSSRSSASHSFTVDDTVNTYTSGPASTATFLSAATFTAVNVGLGTYTVTVTAVGVAAAFNATACNVSGVKPSPIIGTGSNFSCVSGSGTTCTTGAFSSSGSSRDIVIAYGTSYDATGWTAGTAGSNSMVLISSTAQGGGISPASEVESVILTGAATTASIITAGGFGDPVYIMAVILDQLPPNKPSPAAWIL